MSGIKKGIIQGKKLDSNPVNCVRVVAVVGGFQVGQQRVEFFHDVHFRASLRSGHPVPMTEKSHVTCHPSRGEIPLTDIFRTATVCP